MTRARRETGPDLSILDPGLADAGYWRRFETRVLTTALPALARRRRAARTTLPEVVNAWSRLLVPAAAAAAITGIFFLATPAEEGVAAVGDLDEVVLPGEEGYGTMPSFLASEDTLDRDVVEFAVGDF
jgi:hypothetical protein